MVALPGPDYGQFMYVGWMLQVRVTIQSILKAPAKRVEKAGKVGKNEKKILVMPAAA